MSEESGIFEITAGNVQYAVVIGIILLTLGVLNGFTLDPGIAESYTTYYINLSIMCVIGGIFVTVYLGRFILGNLVSVETVAKVVIAAVWIGFFTYLSLNAVSNNSQIIGVPNAVTTPLSTIAPDETFTRAFIPALLEDFWFFYVFPGLIAMFMLIFYEFVFPGEDAGFITYSVTMVIATFFGALNFTAAHFAAYGNQIDAFIGAFVFGWGQSLVYAFTGIFFPAAHFLHNYIVTVSPQFAIVAFMPLLIPFKLRGDSHDK